MDLLLDLIRDLRLVLLRQLFQRSLLRLCPYANLSRLFASVYLDAPVDLIFDGKRRGSYSFLQLQLHNLLFFYHGFVDVLLLLELTLELVNFLLHLDEDFGLLSVDLPEPLLHGLFIPDYHAQLCGLGQPFGIESFQLFEAG